MENENPITVTRFRTCLYSILELCYSGAWLNHN